MQVNKMYIAAYSVLIMLMMLSMCGNSRNRKTISKLQSQIDSMRVELRTHPTLQQLQIENLQTSKRTLYDWNSVVRTAVRPDDRMNEYDQEIKKLQN